MIEDALAKLRAAGWRVWNLAEQREGHWHATLWTNEDRRGVNDPFKLRMSGQGGWSRTGKGATMLDALKDAASETGVFGKETAAVDLDFMLGGVTQRNQAEDIDLAKLLS